MEKQFNTYPEVIDFLFSQLPMYQRLGKAAYKANLDTTLKLDTHFDTPHNKYATIHVAGTNGKGSVSHILCSVLMAAGYKVGLYTSPHLKDFRERIKVNGTLVPKTWVIEFVRKNLGLFSQLSPSFFEMTVAMAFQYFKESKVDFAVIETGLGGRLDSTNIITPRVSIITNIGHDHQEFLGHTLERIAKEKAGIIKQGVPVIIGETQESLKPLFLRAASTQKTTIRFADSHIHVAYALVDRNSKLTLGLKKDGVDYFPNLKSDLLGEYQRQNIITALAGVECLREEGINISDQAVYSGMESVRSSTGLYGRWQILGNNPLTVCDTGHNIEGIKRVLSQIANTAFRELHFIIGVVREKSLEEILTLLPGSAYYYFVQASIPRAMEAQELMTTARKFGLKGQAFSSVRKGLERARSTAHQDDMIFVGGSTYVVAEVV